ncbi:hypothetical protein HTZ97_01965 [Desulfuromonas acetoxidans]|uniref:hypothetical protein n=1 Tax=Desulfuromonas acetoxidans TaxID=891 RepID=UPI0015932B11|nr:hypothetical protein [Desulfuromonas acetoxidans]MBF0646829.1 hypothetical protein [Desulfuromonas acetoxidans]NVD24933.1 hypothetical protein [Desulfuromonas acetoxidans]NVE15234.1 hypothetical protein [Desulfuromonas acetoxidans]
MKKIISFLIWTVCFIVLLIISDQFLLRYPGSSVPVLGEFQRFYHSFRSRVLQESLTLPPTETAPSAAPASVPQTAAEKAAPQYIYVDESGQLNFASTLDEIPPRLRDAAEPLTGD